MREAWPADKPMSVRISANDWAGEDGVTPDEAVLIAEAFAQAGADLIDVSAGQTWADAQPVYGRLFQTPSPTRSATRRSWRRWRSATSPTPTRSTPS
jgi:anthraniloyl-CoA monooxygenase